MNSSDSVSANSTFASSLSCSLAEDESFSAQPVPLDQIRQVIKLLLAQCAVPYLVKPYDQSLHDHCIRICKDRGYPIDPSTTDCNEPSLLPFLPTGVYIASTSYDHLVHDIPRIAYIALYSAFVTYLDDLFKRDIDSVSRFTMRLVRGERQDHPVLAGLMHLLDKDTEPIFGRTSANLIVHDTLGFLNSLIMDYETQEMNWSSDALEFPNYTRLMGGIPTAYAIFIFPSDMPFKTYIQALPPIRHYICYLNDVLSFYKEEICGEKDNYISLVSASQKSSKWEVLKKLADDVGRTTDQINRILQTEPAALEAWTGFKGGYVYFHTSNERYKLEFLKELVL